MVWRQRRVCPASEAGAHAGGRERPLVASGYEYRCHRIDRSLWTGCRERTAQDPHRTRGALRAFERNHFLYPARRLVCLRVCDNLLGRTLHPATANREVIIMNVELEQEYAVLKDKVRELREYL